MPRVESPPTVHAHGHVPAFRERGSAEAARNPFAELLQAPAAGEARPSSQTDSSSAAAKPSQSDANCAKTDSPKGPDDPAGVASKDHGASPQVQNKAAPDKPANFQATPAIPTLRIAAPSLVPEASPIAAALPLVPTTATDAAAQLARLVAGQTTKTQPKPVADTDQGTTAANPDKKAATSTDVAADAGVMVVASLPAPAPSPIATVVFTAAAPDAALAAAPAGPAVAPANTGITPDGGKKSAPPSFEALKASFAVPAEAPITQAPSDQAASGPAATAPIAVVAEPLPAAKTVPAAGPGATPETPPTPDTPLIRDTASLPAVTSKVESVESPDGKPARSDKVPGTAAQTSAPTSQGNPDSAAAPADRASTADVTTATSGTPSPAPDAPTAGAKGHMGHVPDAAPDAAAPPSSHSPRREAPLAPAPAPLTPDPTVATSGAAAPVEAGTSGVAATNSAQPAATVAASAAASPSQPAVLVPLVGLGVEIAVRAQAGKNRFDIRLDPPELGRVEVRLNVDHQGRVSSHLIAERSDTLDLLRREAPQLQRALQEAGFKTSDNAMQFSMRDQGFAGRNQQGSQDQPVARLVIPDSESTSARPTPSGYGRWLGGGTGLDIRV